MNKIKKKLGNEKVDIRIFESIDSTNEYLKDMQKQQASVNNLFG